MFMWLPLLLLFASAWSQGNINAVGEKTGAAAGVKGRSHIPGLPATAGHLASDPTYQSHYLAGLNPAHHAGHLAHPYGHRGYAAMSYFKPGKGFGHHVYLTPGHFLAGFPGVPFASLTPAQIAFFAALSPNPGVPFPGCTYSGQFLPHPASLCLYLRCDRLASGLLTAIPLACQATQGTVPTQILLNPSSPPCTVFNPTCTGGGPRSIGPEERVENNRAFMQAMTAAQQNGNNNAGVTGAPPGNVPAATAGAPNQNAVATAGSPNQNAVAARVNVFTQQQPEANAIARAKAKGNVAGRTHLLAVGLGPFAGHIPGAPGYGHYFNENFPHLAGFTAPYQQYGHGEHGHHAAANHHGLHGAAAAHGAHGATHGAHGAHGAVATHGADAAHGAHGHGHGHHYPDYTGQGGFTYKHLHQKINPIMFPHNTMYPYYNKRTHTAYEQHAEHAHLHQG